MIFQNIPHLTTAPGFDSPHVKSMYDELLVTIEDLNKRKHTLILLTAFPWLKLHIERDGLPKAVYVREITFALADFFGPMSIPVNQSNWLEPGKILFSWMEMKFEWPFSAPEM